jgi:hypothetical protein
MKLKLNLRDIDLAYRFGVSRATVYNVVKTFICLLHEVLFVSCICMPSQLKCRGSLPACFNEFTNARVVIDATEITVDVPQDMSKQASCYSNYKSRHTAKIVIGIAPNGAIVFCSNCYPGSTSDVAIVKDCGIIDMLEVGDLILADKGFTIHSLLPEGVHINIPPFLRGKSQFTYEEAQMCRKIAKARIHIERANERVKNFAILSHISHSYRPFASKIVQLCCALVNLQAPLLKEISVTDSQIV